MKCVQPKPTPARPRPPRPRRPGDLGPAEGCGKWPFDRVPEGGSFFVPNELLGSTGAHAIRQAANRWARRRGIKFHPFTVRTFPMGVQVTRVAIGDERGHQTRKYPWLETPVGDSFFVPRSALPKKGLCGLHNALSFRRAQRPEAFAGVRYTGKTTQGGVLMTRLS